MLPDELDYSRLSTDPADAVDECAADDAFHEHRGGRPCRRCRRREFDV